MMEQIKFETWDAIVVGTGAAGFNAACRIRQLGKKSVAIVTEGRCCGTSRNTGSDKQTYYKLGLGGSSPDSVRQMAQELFAGGSVDGDTALCEAALSTRSFLNLAELGVPFPVNRFGEYTGYKTDHDPHARATSAGPLTSSMMTQVLEKQAAQLNIPIYDNLLAIELLHTENDGICGLLCLNCETGQFQVFRASNIVLATGGPAGIYEDSVYPVGQHGSTGLALSAGVPLQNMTHWQYGLASVAPRWNVSGTYMQVLPRFVSIGENGTEHEFLADFFSDPYEALSCVFLKGYQWPFDCRKVLEGSSVIDLLVYREQAMKGRRVYLDYTRNPFGMEYIDFARLAPEAAAYLQKAGACFGTPFQRLEKMNAPAAALYRSKGRRLDQEYLQIALCAQHCNGGIAVDLWWQTAMPGLFAAGECAGTHGVFRPGGSALNAGQVGSLRAAQYLSASDRPPLSESRFRLLAQDAVLRQSRRSKAWMSRPDNTQARISAVRHRMSCIGAAIRIPQQMEEALRSVRGELDRLDAELGVSGPSSLVLAYQLQDLLLTQEAVLTAFLDESAQGSGSRGSALYTESTGILRAGLEEAFRFRLGDGTLDAKIQQVRLLRGRCSVSWRDVRPIPDDDDFFENVWRQFRINRNIY